MQIGSTVTLAYRGTLDDGTMFGYADAEKPMVFQTGMEQAIEGFEKKILELENVGDKATFTVGMYDAYGEYHDDWTDTMPIEALAVDTAVGKRIWLWDDEGGKMPVTVIDITDNTVTFDMNHPLAGKDLNFEVEILGIEAPEEGFVPEAQKRAERERMSGMLSNGF